MITSCDECGENNCCKFGVGAHEVLAVDLFIKKYGTPRVYNTQCEGLEDGKCKYWGTDKLPMICKTWVCSVRTYTREEIKKINKLLKM